MGKKDTVALDTTRQAALTDINDRYGVGEQVMLLQRMMKKVTEKEITADTVNAACNCSSNINTTIKTIIAAAKFLSDK